MEKIVQISDLEKITSGDILLLKRLWSAVEPDKEALVDAFYAHLSQFDEVKRLIKIVEQKVREQKVKGDFKYLITLWVVGAFAGIYDENYANNLRRTFYKYVQVGIPLKVMLSSQSYFRNLILFHLSKTLNEETANKTASIMLAFNKVMDYTLLIICEVYMANANKIIFRSKF